MLIPSIDTVKHLFSQPQTVASKTVLLAVGQVARSLYLLRTGCVRSWVPTDGCLLTTHFFLENESFASIESFMTGEPSLYALETIEPSTLLEMPKEEFDDLLAQNDGFRAWFHGALTDRFLRLNNRLLAHLRYSPQQRYEELLRTEPHLLLRMPQHHLASYLGITRVSLSRIRNRF